jgi:cytochrome b6-f complex iron-sulfur subunit
MTECDPDAAPEPADSISRRRMITIGSFGVLGAASLAACGGSSGGTDNGSATDSTTSAAGTSAAAAGSGSGSGTKLAKLADVPVGSAILLDVGGTKVLLAQPTEGTAVAFSAICPHQGCTVNPGTQPKCPCHGSTFDLATGKNLSGPAPSPLKAVSVSVENGEVVMKA